MRSQSHDKSQSITTLSISPKQQPPQTFRRTVGLGVVSLLSMLGCNDLSGLAGRQPLPSGTSDPSVYHTAAGALALYQSTVLAFQYVHPGQVSLGGGSISPDTTALTGAFVDYVFASGLLTDELQTGQIGGSSTFVQGATTTSNVDARLLPEGLSNLTDNLYTELQAIRNNATEGIGALTAYDSSAPPALRGHLLALQGYTELLMSELYCSGIPLSTINFSGKYTYARGDSTDEVVRDAEQKFRAALPLAIDSSRIANFARVGLARAYLDLGQFDSAGIVAAQVPDAFAYQFLVDWSGGLTVGQNLFTANNATVANREGTTGLPYITNGANGDPRTASDSATANAYGRAQYVPVKSGGSVPGISSITVADGIEARLIQAEAALHHQQYGTWLTMLNQARALAAPSLSALTDPGASPQDTARVLLLFRERAYDLFLTGHRQGDLRRLIRQYGFTAQQVYPTGTYPTGNPMDYGTAVTAPIPTAEKVNPRFTGCYSRGA